MEKTVFVLPANNPTERIRSLISTGTRLSALLLMAASICACDSNVASAPAASAPSANAALPRTQVANNPSPAPESKVADNKPQNCATVLDDVTNIAKKNIPQLKAAKFNWSNAVATQAHPDVGGFDCEAELSLETEAATVQAGTVNYSILPLADGSGVRISVDQDPILVAQYKLVNNTAAANRQKEIKEFATKLEKWQPVFGTYTDGKNALEIAYRENEPIAKLTAGCCITTFHLKISDDKTLTGVDGPGTVAECRIDIKAEDMGHSVLTHFSPNPRVCNMENNDSTFIKN